MTSKAELPDGHLQFLKALSRPTDYQKLLIELYEKTERSPIEEKKLHALIRTEKANIRANKAKKDMQHLLNAENKKQQAQQRKDRTKRLIELGALFDIAKLGHHDPATLVGMLNNISTAIAPDSDKWTNWHKQGVLSSTNENRLKTQNKRNQRTKITDLNKIDPFKTQCGFSKYPNKIILRGMDLYTLST